MLRPEDTTTRETKRLDGLWNFTPDSAGAGRVEGWWRTTLARARPMPVPSSFNDVLVDPEIHDHVGDVWYQRQIFVPRGLALGRIVLRFDAATHRATVWIDDTLITEHEGGYTPFETDVTTFVQPGGEYRLTVVVNNELTWQSIPPGVVEVLPNGTRRQRQYHDFFNYAGLHRSVWLYATPHSRLADLTVATYIDEGGRSGAVLGGPGERGFCHRPGTAPGRRGHRGRLRRGGRWGSAGGRAGALGTGPRLPRRPRGRADRR